MRENIFNDETFTASLTLVTRATFLVQYIIIVSNGKQHVKV